MHMGILIENLDNDILIIVRGGVENKKTDRKGEYGYIIFVIENANLIHNKYYIHAVVVYTT